jgi:hypothetical protein
VIRRVLHYSPSRVLLPSTIPLSGYYYPPLLPFPGTITLHYSPSRVILPSITPLPGYYYPLLPPPPPWVLLPFYPPIIPYPGSIALLLSSPIWALSPLIYSLMGIITIIIPLSELYCSSVFSYPSTICSPYDKPLPGAFFFALLHGYYRSHYPIFFPSFWNYASPHACGV